jgi:nucleotide-binding universal stress UspA family protein
MTSLLAEAPTAGPSQAARAAIRTVLVHVRPEPEARARLATAAALAASFDATLFGLAAETVPPLGAMDPTGLMQGAWYADMRQQVQDDLERARATFDEATRGLKTDFAWIDDMPAAALARAARAADVIVAGGCPVPGGDRYRQCDAAEVMLQAGRPVLVTPPEGGALAARSVVIAWKEGREARRAVADALPFLSGADTVVVLEVCGKDDAEDAELRTASVAAGLKRHDVHAQARVIVAPPERVAGKLDKTAEAIGADLIVAGGYGHSRLGEWVFGGVTRDLLRDPHRFVLLSH